MQARVEGVIVSFGVITGVSIIVTTLVADMEVSPFAVAVTVIDEAVSFSPMVRTPSSEIEEFAALGCFERLHVTV